MTNEFRVENLNDYTKNRAFLDEILSRLPGWFGPYDVYEEYLDDLETRPVFGVFFEGKVVGMMALSKVSESTIDIHVMAVSPEMHGRGIGSTLVRHAEGYARDDGASFLTVKSLGPSHKNEFYPKTHAFYASVGFEPIEEFADFWGEGFPMLLLCKSAKIQSRRHQTGRQLCPKCVSSKQPEFCVCSERQQCGLQLQHRDTCSNGG